MVDETPRFQSLVAADFGDGGRAARFEVEVDQKIGALARRQADSAVGQRAGLDRLAIQGDEPNVGMLDAQLQNAGVAGIAERSAARRVGKACVSKCRSRWSL